MTRAVICPQCHTEAAADSRFCDQCAAALPLFGDVAAPPSALDGLPSVVSVAPTVSRPMPGTLNVPPISVAPAPPVSAPPVESLPALSAVPRHRVSPLLIGGLLLVTMLFVGAVVLSAALLLTNRSAVQPAAGTGLDPTVATALIQKQATALAAQQTITALYNFQATQIALRPAQAQATMTALSNQHVPGTLDPTMETARATTTTSTALPTMTTTPRAGTQPNTTP